MRKEFRNTIDVMQPKELVDLLIDCHQKFNVQQVSPRRIIHIEAGNGAGKTSQVVLLAESLRLANIEFRAVKGGGLQDADTLARLNNLSNLSKKDSLAIKNAVISQSEFIEKRKLVNREEFIRLVINMCKAMSNAETGYDISKNPDSYLTITDRCVAISGSLGILEREGVNALETVFSQLQQVVLGGLIVLDVDEWIAVRRMKQRGLGEKIDLHELSSQRSQFSCAAKKMGDKATIINASGDIEEVHNSLIRNINQLNWLPQKIDPLTNPLDHLKRIFK